MRARGEAQAEHLAWRLPELASMRPSLGSLSACATTRYANLCARPGNLALDHSAKYDRSVAQSRNHPLASSGVMSFSASPVA